MLEKTLSHVYYLRCNHDASPGNCSMRSKGGYYLARNC